jgi:hypothetical protein
LRLVLILALAALGLLLASCDLTSPEEVAQNEIRDIIYDLSSNFNWKLVDGIMDHAHPDYLHDGMQSFGLRQLWLDRMSQYDLLDCEIQEVEVDGDFALVRMRMTFTSATGELVLDEPQDSGDASYFYNGGNGWRLYGNQLLGR